MNIGARIANIMHKCGETYEEFAAHFPVHPMTVRSWVGGHTNPKREHLIKLAELGGVSIDWLLGREKPEADLSELLRDHERRIDQWMRDQENRGNLIEVAAEDFVMVPVVGRVSAGPGTIAEQDIEEYLPVPKQDIPAGCTPFFVRVVGNCMAQTAGIWEGDLVFVAKGLDVNDGDLVVVTVDGEAKVKRLRRTSNDAILVSDDPAEPITAASEVEIAGPVLWSRRYHGRT